MSWMLKCCSGTFFNDNICPKAFGLNVNDSGLIHNSPGTVLKKDFMSAVSISTCSKIGSFESIGIVVVGNGGGVVESKSARLGSSDALIHFSSPSCHIYECEVKP